MLGLLKKSLLGVIAATALFYYGASWTFLMIFLITAWLMPDNRETKLRKQIEKQVINIRQREVSR